MTQKLDYLKESPSQTAGPYVHIGCVPNAVGVTGVYDEDLGSSLFAGASPSDAITIKGTIYDGLGSPLTDAMVEIWQADANGLYASPEEKRGQADSGFTGWGRSAGDLATGEFSFTTVKPGVVPFVDGRDQAPHITFWVVARGINTGLHTRLYFGDESQANASDPILQRIDPMRVGTLLAQPESDGVYRFNIRLQGDNETVFFDM